MIRWYDIKFERDFSIRSERVHDVLQRTLRDLANAFVELSIRVANRA